ncbi:hypothetical protein FI667_g5123, partial [Globisporangium splendens]
MEEQENMNTNRETAKDGEQSTVVSSRVCTSSTSRAVWEKIQDAKQIQRTHRHNAPKYSNARHHLLSGRSKDGIRDAEDFSNVNRVTTAGFPAEACVAVSPVSVVPPVPRAKPVKPLELLPRHNILKTAITGEDTRPEHPTTVRVDEVVRVAQAVYRIQVAWRRYKKRRDPSNQRTDTGTCVEAADAKYVGNEPNVQPDSPELPRPSAATKKSLGRRAKAGEIGATAEHLAQMDEDISPLEHCSGELIDVKDPQPLGTLWMEDEWVSLEEGLYLGDQKDEFCAFSSSIHEFLLWKQPHNLIQIRENQRLAALRAQRQWRADTSTDIVITTNESQDEKSEDNLTQNRKTPSPVSSLLCQIPLSKVRIRSRRWRAKPIKITFRRRARKRPADCVISNHDQSNSLQTQLVTNLNDQSEGDADESSDESSSAPVENSFRNDLISIGDLTVAGDLHLISTHFGSDKHELHTEKHGHAVAEDVSNDDPARTLGSLKQSESEASEVVLRMRQKHERYLRFESIQLTGVANPLRSPGAVKSNAVGEAKQQEFRKILDEFKVSLQQSTGLSSSPSSLLLLLPFKQQFEKVRIVQ